MPRIKTARSYVSDSTENEFDRVDSELTKLKREYRILNNEKKKAKNDADAKVLTQQAQIKQLLKEKSNYELELSLADSNQNNKVDNTNLSRMQTNLQYKATITKQIEDQKKVQGDLEQQCLIWSKKLHEQRIKMGGAEKTSGFHKVVNRKVDIAEGNLHREASKFNNILASNEQYRARIDTLRHEREKFKVKLALLNQKYQENKTNINNVVESSQSAYDMMLEARSKIKVQQEKSQKELEQFINEITTEEKKIDHELKQQEFMNIKGTERDDSERVNIERDAARKYNDQRSNLLNDLENAWSKIKIICNEGSEASSAQPQPHELSSDTSVETAIRKFEESEEANFALFNFVSDQNNEIEKMQEELDNIKNEQENNNAILQSVEDEAENQYDELENTKLELEAAVEIANGKIKAESDSLQKISAGVLDLFKKLDCDEEALGIALKSEMLDEFIATYLAVIEAKLNTLLSAKIYLRSQDPDNDEDFSAADAIREVLGKVERPKINNPPINSLFENQYHQMNNERSSTLQVKLPTSSGGSKNRMGGLGGSVGNDLDENDSDNEMSTGSNMVQMTDTKLGQIADTGMILSYDQLRDRVRSDIGRRKVSIVQKPGNKRPSMVKGMTDSDRLDRSVDSRPEAILE